MPDSEEPYGTARRRSSQIIRVVEDSELSARRTLRELDVNRSSFYEWYRRYRLHGYDGLPNQSPSPKRFWNRIPETEKKRIVKTALEHPERSPRELARSRRRPPYSFLGQGQGKCRLTICGSGALYQLNSEK